MRPIIKEDIENVLSKVLAALEKHDFIELSKLSNHTIHDASIFQEDDPLTLAVLVYSLSKVIRRCVERDKSCPLVESQLKSALEALRANDDNAYRTIIKRVLQGISEMDSQMKLYIQEVVSNARIKKGSKIHEHGISIARTAELLGLSMWELQNYIGKTVSDVAPDGIRVKDRLRKARELFE
ncbi:hypothetical protein J4219_00370 [Candidatus Woesearchaeota archaeon]|nr:hypothetical protein [Candidatus Woesearchaeota archaeon]